IVEYKKLAVIFVLLVTIVLSSCAKSENISTKSKEASDKILTLAMPAIAGSSDIKKIIPQFKKETGIKEDWNEFDYNTNYERVLNDMKYVQGTYDVIFMNNIWVPMFAGGGFEVLRKFNEFSNTGPPGSSNYNSDELVRTMAQGSALMSLIWSPQINGIEDEENLEVA